MTVNSDVLFICAIGKLLTTGDLDGWRCAIALSKMPGAPDRLRKNIVLWMAQREINQTQLAKAAHISQGFMSQILRGKRDLPTRTVQAIADALRVPVERLWQPKGGIKQLLESDEPIDPMLAQAASALNAEGTERLLEQAQFLAESGKFSRTARKKGT